MTRKRILKLMLVISIFGSLFSNIAVCQETPYDFSFKLSISDRPGELSYLGLPKDVQEFSLDQIDAKIVLIEIFSMYCPICQREAAPINELFQRIQQDNYLGDRVRVIGIGAGNSDFETQFFKSNYAIPFPLFSDADFVIHKQVNEVGTPHFFGLHIIPGETPRLFFPHAGPIKDLQVFINNFKNAARQEAGQ